MDGTYFLNALGIAAAVILIGWSAWIYLRRVPREAYHQWFPWLRICLPLDHLVCVPGRGILRADGMTKYRLPRTYLTVPPSAEQFHMEFPLWNEQGSLLPVRVHVQLKSQYQFSRLPYNQWFLLKHDRGIMLTRLVQLVNTPNQLKRLELDCATKLSNLRGVVKAAEEFVRRQNLQVVGVKRAAEEYIKYNGSSHGVLTQLHDVVTHYGYTPTSCTMTALATESVAA